MLTSVLQRVRLHARRRFGAKRPAAPAGAGPGLARWRVRLCFVLPLVLSVLASSPPALADGAGWTQFHGDAQHTGRALVAGPQSLALAWYALGGDDFDSSPVIGPDGSVYAVSTDGLVQGLNADGSQRWAAGAGARVYASPVLGQDGRVLVGYVAGRFRAYDPADGRVVWSLAGFGSIRGTAAVGADGSIYFGTDGGELVALDAAGSERFRVQARGAIVGAPAITSGGDLFWGSLDGRFRRMAPNGDIRWEVEVDGAVFSAASIGSDGTVYLGAGRSILALDPDSGAVRWRVGVGAEVMTTPAIGPDGTIYAGSENGLVTAVVPSGTVRWQFQTGGAVRSSAAVGADGTIYVGSGDGTVYALSPNGERLSSFRALDAVHGAVAIGPTGLVYAGARDNRLYALKDSARRFRESPLDRLGGDLVRDPATGRVFVIVDGQRRHIPDPITQLILGLATPTPIALAPNELRLYPEGPPLPALTEGSLIRQSNGAIYVLRAGRRVWIRTLNEFLAGGYAWESLVPVDDRTARSIPLDLQDGMLIKGIGERVYLFTGGQRRWIPDTGVFTAHGYDWSQVHFVPEATLQALPEGPTLA